MPNGSSLLKDLCSRNIEIILIQGSVCFVNDVFTRNVTRDGADGCSQIKRGPLELRDPVTELGHISLDNILPCGDFGFGEERVDCKSTGLMQFVWRGAISSISKDDADQAFAKEGRLVGDSSGEGSLE